MIASSFDINSSLTSESVFDKIMRYDLLRAPKSNGSVAALVKDFETFQQFFTSVTILLLIDIPFMFLFLYAIYAIGGPLVYVPLIIIPLVAFFLSWTINIPSFLLLNILRASFIFKFSFTNGIFFPVSIISSTVFN